MSNFPAAGVYNIDAVHSTFAFVARHLVVSKVRGRFAEFEGTITVGDSPATSSVLVTVQSNSITTDNEMRDNHIKSNDFLGQETYPTLTFKSTSLTSTGGSDYSLVGDLTIRDVTKSVTFAVEFTGEGPTFVPGQSVIGFEATAEIDRREFNVNFEGNLENGAAVVSHKIIIELNVEASTVAPA
ncbi:MAG: YceI family protein [Acidimicrobiaceae bacterium]|nr:YceI family protein [Acidimicrobiaceae bacterium]